MISKNLSTEVDFVQTTEQPSTIAGVDANSIQNLALDDPKRVGLVMRAMAKQAASAVRVDEPQDAISNNERLLEIILEKNNVLPAWFLEVGTQYARAVCKIETSGTNYKGQQGEWSGTGFLVSPNILLTNYHVLNSSEAAKNAICIFNYQKDQMGKMLPTKGFYLCPNKLFISSPASADGLDFTFVWIDKEPGREFGFIPLDRNSFKIVLDDCANIIQHPNGNPKSIVLQENKVQYQDVAVVRYTSDTEPGSSGSCVFNNEWKPIALHHASKSVAPKKYLNEGIKFSAIATYLEQLSKDSNQQVAATTLLELIKGTDTLMGFFGSIGRTVSTGTIGLETVVNAYKGEADDIDVGFWNIEWFNRNYQEKLDDVAQIIVSMNLDIWAFEESSPQATEALVKHLNDNYKMDFGWDASEPKASSSKQTTTVIWNKKTVEGKKQNWPDEIDSWFKVHSKDFDELDLEAVEGRVFDRYPGLFYFTAANRKPNAQFNFYLVPLHLKAMSEGSMRRRMASQILTAAIKKMTVEYKKDEDWIVGGDYNAELASEDFSHLISGGMIPISAEDEKGGAFSYAKSPKSLIDHIFLSANLAKTYGAKDFFIVAKDKAIPSYITSISDHRPVLVRLSLKAHAPSVNVSPSIPDSLREALSEFSGSNSQVLSSPEDNNKHLQPEKSQDITPQFEGFFLQMVLPHQEGRAKAIAAQVLGSDWNVKPIGDNLTEFEVTHKEGTLSVSEAWQKAYELRSQPGVVDAEPLFAVPVPDRFYKNDEPRSLEAGFQAQKLNESNDPEWSLKQLRVFEAWSRFSNRKPGEGIVIGHPDTGYTKHPEIAQNLLLDKGRDFLKGDNNPEDELEKPVGVLIPNPGHGTSTASVIVSPQGAQVQGTYPSGKAMTGVAPSAKLIPLRITHSVVLWSVQALAEAIEYAADRGAHVISMSLGTGFANKRLRSAIAYAQKRGVIILSAAGNHVPYVVWPAAYDEVIAVAASNEQREIWEGSSRGSQVDVTAPGELVWHAQVDLNQGKLVYDVVPHSGTSFAVAAVAGVAALWLSYHGREQLVQRYGAEKIPFIFNQILRDSCEKFPTWKPDQFGAGIVNAEKVLAAKLPDRVNYPAIAPASVLQEHLPGGNGGLNTFVHLFEQHLSDSQLETNFVGTASLEAKLQSRLAELLKTTETELPKRLAEVGQELAFYFAVNPQLYNQFAATLESHKSHSAQVEMESLAAPLEQKNMGEVREMLLSQGISEVLKAKFI